MKHIKDESSFEFFLYNRELHLRFRNSISRVISSTGFTGQAQSPGAISFLECVYYK